MFFSLVNFITTKVVSMARTKPRTHTHTHARAHTHAHTRAHTYERAHTHTHTHTHTGLVKGYIAHKQQVVVLKKDDPFRTIS